MFKGHVSSWNLRDRHMSDTLDALSKYLKQHDGHAKCAVWAHNSHLGDARATEMGSGGELNVGQLTRERHGGDAVLVGFSTYSGTMTAASDWDRPAEKKHVRAALPDSYEELFHDAGSPAFGLILTDGRRPVVELPEPLLQRAIGVVYRPETERLSHYFHSHLTSQFDVLLHFDVTTAVEPLERTPEWETGEWETFPSGM